MQKSIQIIWILYTFSFLRLILSTNLILKSSFSRMDIGKQRKPSVDAKYLHAFAPSPLSQNGQHGLRHPVEGKSKFIAWLALILSTLISRYVSKYAIYVTIFNIDSAFKKIKILQEASLEHHPTTVSCPTPARRRHRTTFTQVCDLKPQLLSLFVFKKDILFSMKKPLITATTWK